MDCLGRMAEVFLCILCLTLVPAESILRLGNRQQQNHIEVRAEQLYGRIKEERSLTRTDYEYFKEIFAHCPDYDFELAIARRYVMPAGSMGSADHNAVMSENKQNAPVAVIKTEHIANGMPVKILYRSELEEEFLSREEISLAGSVFINISVYGKEGYFYTCGGEVW